MDNQFEQSNISFKKHTGKETTAEVLAEIPIAKGNFGEIYYARLKNKGHARNFIIKKYTGGGDTSKGERSPNEIEADARKHAKKALENYALAKEAGLKIFPTFRIGDDEKSILMTAGSSENEACVSANGPLAITDFAGQSLIEDIEDADKFLENFFAEGLKAAKAGLILNGDVFFFILSKNKKPTQMDFVVGDLEGIKKSQPSERTAKKNLEEIRMALFAFCNSNINLHFSRNFLDKVKNHYRKSLEGINKGELK